jgi:3-methyl-2-oxobutanoate hydroxymethyltransferase
MSATPPKSASPRPVTTATFRERKASGERIVMITAYDTATARLVDEAGVDAILVGDSLGMAVLGHSSTLPVTMDDMIRHTAAVSRGVSHALVIGDMPFMSFQVCAEDALRNAGRFLAEGGASAVKLEGGVTVADTVARITGAGIPVMGHVGLTPQSVHQFGGYKAQGKESAAAARVIQDCHALEDAGAFAVVLECVPAGLASLVSHELRIPTIGIGAGVECDGEVQVFHDLVGMGGSFTPKHARHYAEVGDIIRDAVATYAGDVRARTFPGAAQSIEMDAAVLEEVRATATEASGGRPRGD